MEDWEDIRDGFAVAVGVDAAVTGVCGDWSWDPSRALTPEAGIVMSGIDIVAIKGGENV